MARMLRCTRPLVVVCTVVLCAAVLAVNAQRQGPTCRMEPDAAHQFCGLPLQLSNFQGSHQCNKAVLVGRPANTQELARLVQSYERVKAVGVGHSWNRDQFCAGNSSAAIGVVLTELNPSGKAAVRVDEQALTATVPGGLTQRSLLEVLDAYRTAAAPDGYTLPAFSWFLDQTVAGAVATATHGSSLVFGSLSSQLKGLKLMVANGTVIELTPRSSPHLWKAAAVSVGRLGITLEVTIAIVKNSPVRRDKADVNVPAFVADIKALSANYTRAVGSAAGNTGKQMSLAVWEAVKAWDEVQWFFFIPSRDLWRASFKRLTPLSAEDVTDVLAMDRQPEGALLPGAFQQQSVQAAGTGVGIESNARYWSDNYRLFLAQNVAPGTLPARQAFLSVTELESKIGGSWNSYDQYEVAIPLSNAGTCMEALAAALYSSDNLWKGFRTPALLRLIRAETLYLSPAHGEPALYLNAEDHLKYATKRPNAEFQAVMALLRSDVCRGRLHWGKAGWAEAYGRCFDGAEEFPRSWCHFGCAVQQLDPTGKFAGLSSVWRWRAEQEGRAVDFASCCTAEGFDDARCRCVPAVPGAGCRRE